MLKRAVVAGRRDYGEGPGGREDGGEWEFETYKMAFGKEKDGCWLEDATLEMARVRSQAVVICQC